MSNTCLLGRYCVPQGSSICQGWVCAHPMQCADDKLCCNMGEHSCGGTCCNQACLQDRCLPFGSTICGANVCSPGRVCLDNQICCSPSETFCNGGCCASGMTCINRMCVPFGSEECGPSVVCNPSQFCGNSNTGLCCHRSDQIACGRDCCPSSQVCGDHDRCEDASSEDSRCSPGQHWCAPAHVCCPYGWSCGFTCTSPWAG
uniref:Uncharacterized protein n=1 Tax=Tetradesmus obliquus TaxID=3088 RepID=A0A383VJK8_TETOB|eukprot:jgi/Sobl393_1/1372/SZX64834.1